MTAWLRVLAGDPVPWLLEDETPAVRHLALRQLLDQPEDAPEGLVGFGWLEADRVQRAIDWQACSITGEDFSHYYRSGTSGPGFRCASNQQLPCAWGAIKGLLALARIPSARRAPHVQRAIQQGAAFLLSSDPAIAAYPAGWGNEGPSPAWFQLGFPLNYGADLLQNLSVLCELGFAKDARLAGAVAWLLSQ